MEYTANTGKRIIAYLIDSIITSFCLLPVWIQVAGSYLRDGVVSVDLSWILVSALLILFYRWLFLYFLGGTLGKLIMGLRIVPMSNLNQELGLLQSLIRVLTDGLSIFFGQAPRALALLRYDRTQLADWVAETRVVQATPRKRPPVRRKILAILIVLISGWNTFTGAYFFFQEFRFEEGKITMEESPVQR